MYNTGEILLPPRFAHGFRKVGHLESVVQKREKLQDFVVLVQGELQKKSAGMSNVFFFNLGIPILFWTEGTKGK